VANEGSNDVTILLGQIAPAGWTLSNGPRLRAGSGPVQTLVSDETNDGVPDILVTNKQSNNVYLLAGLGLGFFDDRNPVIQPTGAQPRRIVPVAPGFATINEGSNNITYFPNFFDSPGFTISSGGQRPVAGLAGDFNGDSFSDLLIAHQGSGVIRLLAGGADGFTLAESFSRGDLPHPAALASVFRDQRHEIFAVNEFGTQAVLVASLGPAPPQPSPVPLSPLLIVVGPGLTLAMSVLTVEFSEGAPGGAATSDTAGTETTLPSPEGSGSEPQNSDESDPLAEAELKRQAHDAAIRELLAGVAEALDSRPPTLPLDEQAASPLDEAGVHHADRHWLQATLGWLTSPELLRLVEIVPLPPGIGPLADAAVALVRGLSPALAVSVSASGATDGFQGDALAVQSSAGAAAADEPAAAWDEWAGDPWLAAVCALGLANGAWTVERRRQDCDETQARRARFRRRARPSS
jgi:hypothetical protein